MKALLFLALFVFSFVACETPAPATGTTSDSLTLDPNRNKAQIDTTMHRENPNIPDSLK